MYWNEPENTGENTSEQTRLFRAIPEQTGMNVPE
jgi:hypothetical protein